MGVLREVLAQHRDLNAVDGIMSDGEVAWLHCTCGWKQIVTMKRDDILIAQCAWEAHLGEMVGDKIAALIKETP